MITWETDTINISYDYTCTIRLIKIDQRNYLLLENECSLFVNIGAPFAYQDASCPVLMILVKSFCGNICLNCVVLIFLYYLPLWKTIALQLNKMGFSINQLTKDNYCQIWWNWPSSFREEDEIVTCLQTDVRTDGRQIIRKAHLNKCMLK